MAIEGTFDVTVFDIMVPGRNGCQICSEIRAAKVWTPILMLEDNSLGVLAARLPIGPLLDRWGPGGPRLLLGQS